MILFGEKLLAEPGRTEGVLARKPDANSSTVPPMPEMKK